MDIIHVRIKYSKTHGAKLICLCHKGIDLYDRHNWYINKHMKTFYLFRNIKVDGVVTTIMFHRELLNLQDGEIRDHKNGNGLDNRISNLRPATHSQNMCNQGICSNNTSGIKGVRFREDHQRWAGEVRYECKRYSREFQTEDDAEKWVREKREELHGEFTNHG